MFCIQYSPESIIKNDVIFSSISLLIFSLYLIYDTQLIYSKFGTEYKIDDNIIAVIHIYLDIINLFIEILKIVGKKIIK